MFWLCKARHTRPRWWRETRLWLFVQPAGASPDADHIAAEFDLCVALVGWEPWSAPSAQLLQAMEQAQRVRRVAPAAVDTISTCALRAEAITELTYEETYFEHLPDSSRY